MTRKRPRSKAAISRAWAARRMREAREAWHAHPDPANQRYPWGDYERKAQAIIDRCGWMIQGVGGGSECFAYTVGLGRLGHPEFLISGPSLDIACRLLNILGGRVRDGRVYRDGEEMDDLLEGYSARLRALEPAMAVVCARVAAHLGQRPHEALRVLQVMWPDRMGRFPGHAGCDPVVARAQDMRRAMEPDS